MSKKIIEVGFIDNNDGTVTDTVTKLMWQKATLSGKYTWQEALKACKDSTIAGYSDWRLPDIKELFSLVDVTKYSPSIAAAYFPDTIGSKYWSSSPYTPNTNEAWFAYFYDGYVNHHYKDNYYYVRCVRSVK